MFLPFVNGTTAAADWVWWLCNSSDMSQIGVLNAHSKNLQLQLNSFGKATCWIHLLDDITAEVLVHQTCLRLDRNGETVWSGPVYQANENSATTTGQQQGQDQLQITAMGWYQILNQREVHTGAEFQAMLAGPNGLAWKAQNGGSYTSPGIDQATSLAYSAVQFPTTTDTVIIYDLLNRANIDSPTLITPGNVYGVPIQRNLTLQRFQNLGQEVMQLVNVESGVDFYINPLTRKMDLFGPGASASSDIPNGMGQDRGQQTLFTYPGNCVSATRSQDGTQTANRVEAIGQYGAGRADDLGSQGKNGLFEVNNSLSEVVDPNILAAYANAEVAVKAQPWTIISFTPRAITTSDDTVPGVPRPFDDFFLGDIVYCTISRGPRFQVGASNPQGVRVFGWTMGIDDNGVEKLSQIQTTYSGAGSL